MESVAIKTYMSLYFILSNKHRSTEQNGFFFGGEGYDLNLYSLKCFMFSGLKSSSKLMRRGTTDSDMQSGGSDTDTGRGGLSIPLVSLGETNKLLAEAHVLISLMFFLVLQIYEPGPPRHF